MSRKKKTDGFYIKSISNGKFSYKENRTGADVLQTQEWDTIDGSNYKKSHYIEYANGIKINEGNFLNDQKDGTWTSWYQNGGKKEECVYVEGVRHGTWAAWHESQGKSSTGRYIGNLKSGLWRSWFKNGSLASTMNFEEELEQMIPQIKSDSSLYKMIKNYEGLLDGPSYWFLSSGDTAAIEIYKNGKMTSVFLFDSFKKANNIPVEKYEVTKKAAFKGDIKTYLKASIEYPDRVGKESNPWPVGGKAIAEFTVTEDGSVKDIKLALSSGFLNWTEK